MLKYKPSQLIKPYLLGLAVLCAVSIVNIGSSVATTIAINFNDTNPVPIPRFDLLGNPLPTFANPASRPSSIDYDATTGHLYGLYQTAASPGSLVRDWAPDGSFIDIPVDVLGFGVGVQAGADIAVHDGTIAISFNDTNPLAVGRFDLLGNPLTPLANPASRPSSIDYDATTGHLYGLYQTAASPGSLVRDWAPDGSFTDIAVDVLGFGVGVQAGADIAVHDGTIAISFNDTNPLNIGRFDLLGNPLTPLANPASRPSSIDYDAATGLLYGLYQTAASPGSLVRVWAPDGSFTDIPVDVLGFGLGVGIGADISVFTGASIGVPEPATLTLFSLGLLALGAARRRNKPASR